MRCAPVFGDPKTDFVFVIGISICDFALWPRRDAPHVPMLSRWRMQEQTSGVTALPQLQLVFLELPKYESGGNPMSRAELPRTESSVPSDGC